MLLIAEICNELRYLKDFIKGEETRNSPISVPGPMSLIIREMFIKNFKQCKAKCVFVIKVHVTKNL